MSMSHYFQSREGGGVIKTNCNGFLSIFRSIGRDNLLILIFIF